MATCTDNFENVGLVLNFLTYQPFTSPGSRPFFPCFFQTRPVLILGTFLKLSYQSGLGIGSTNDFHLTGMKQIHMPGIETGMKTGTRLVLSQLITDW